HLTDKIRLSLYRAYTEETGLNPWIKSETPEFPQIEKTDNHLSQDCIIKIFKFPEEKEAKCPICDEVYTRLGMWGDWSCLGTNDHYFLNCPFRIDQKKVIIAIQSLPEMSNKTQSPIPRTNPNKIYHPEASLRQYAIEHGMDLEKFSVITEAEKKRWAMEKTWKEICALLPLVGEELLRRGILKSGLSTTWLDDLMEEWERIRTQFTQIFSQTFDPNEKDLQISAIKISHEIYFTRRLTSPERHPASHKPADELKHEARRPTERREMLSLEAKKKPTHGSFVRDLMIIANHKDVSSSLQKKVKAIADNIKNDKSERERFLDLLNTYKYYKERKRLQIDSSINLERAVNNMMEKSVTETVLIHTKNHGYEQPGDESEIEDNEGDDDNDGGEDLEYEDADISTPNNDTTDDVKDLDYVTESISSASGSKKRRKSSDESEESDISNNVEYQDELVAKKNRETKRAKPTYVLEWNLYEDLKPIVVEWTIDNTNISDAFFRFKGFAESKAKKHELKFSNHPEEILLVDVLSSFLYNENSNRVQLDISSAIRTKIFDLMKATYPEYSLPKVVKEMCHRCAQVARKQTKEDLEEAIDNSYSDLKTNLKDTHVHHSIHLFLRPFFPDGQDRTIDWANKMSFVSASRKANDNYEGKGHKPDFIITVNKRNGKFELVFGLFKSPYKSSSHYANVDLVDLGVLMKDSLDNMYKEKCIELDMAVFGIHAFGFNVRIYAMDLLYDAVYRMYLIGEFELPKSNISLCLVENALHEVGSLKNFVEEYIERIPPYITNNEYAKTSTEKMRMTRRTVATPRK
ncbi:10891_t:CDS:10, partial [Diversispora eburnea]